MNIKDITGSRAVSHANQGLRPREAGLDILVRLRRRNANRSAARRNAIEEAPFAAKSSNPYEAGYLVRLPRKADTADYLRRALDAGFPADEDAQAVKLLCEKYLESL